MSLEGAATTNAYLTATASHQQSTNSPPTNSNSTTPKVCKAFNKECVDKHFPIEKETYERFSAQPNPPSGILKYYGVHDDIPAGIVLEHAERGDLHHYLRNHWMLFGHPRPGPQTQYLWAEQATEALEFAHSLGVYNSDIHCVNFFLDKNLNLKVGDWAGASIDGGKSHSSYRYRHRLFDTDGTDITRTKGVSVKTEVFAVGTAIYFMVVGEEPWPELQEPEDREEIRRRIAAKMFPDTKTLEILGEVVEKCWNLGFGSMEEVRRAVQAERKLYLDKLGDAAGVKQGSGSDAFERQQRQQQHQRPLGV